MWMNFWLWLKAQEYSRTSLNQPFFNVRSHSMVTYKKSTMELISKSKSRLSMPQATFTLKIYPKKSRAVTQASLYRWVVLGIGFISCIRISSSCNRGEDPFTVFQKPHPDDFARKALIWLVEWRIMLFFSCFFNSSIISVLLVLRIKGVLGQAWCPRLLYNL